LALVPALGRNKEHPKKGRAFRLTTIAPAPRQASHITAGAFTLNTSVVKTRDPRRKPQHCFSRIILLFFDSHATRHLHINPTIKNNNPIKKNNVGFHCHYR
jgi:hypothetical protein